MADTGIPPPPKGITLDDDEQGIPAPPPGITLDLSPGEASSQLESITRPTASPTSQPSSARYDIGPTPARRTVAEGLVTEQQERQGGMPLALHPADYSIQNRLEPAGITPVPRPTQRLASPQPPGPPRTEPLVAPAAVEGGIVVYGPIDDSPEAKAEADRLNGIYAHALQMATPVGGIMRAGRGIGELVASGAFPPMASRGPGQALPTAEQRGAAERSVTDILGGTGEAAASFAPLGVVEKPLATGLAVGGAVAGSYGAGKLADVVKASPDTKGLLQEAGGWLGAMGGGALNARVQSLVSPEQALGEVLYKRGFIRDANGEQIIIRTREEAQAVAGEILRQNPKGTVESWRVKRNLQHAAESMPEPSAEEIGQRHAAAAQQRSDAAEREAAVANTQEEMQRPAPAGLPMHEITADEIAEVGRNISAMPDDVRAQAMLEAHKRLAGEILQQGKFVGPDGKIQIITKPAQAEALAQKLLNESITQGVKQEAANVPPPPAGITLDEKPAKAAQPGEVQGQAFQKEDRVLLPNGDTGTVKNITSTLARVALDKGGRVSIHPSRLKAAAAASGEATVAGKGPENVPASTAPEISPQTTPKNAPNHTTAQTQSETIPAPPAGITESKPTQDQKPVQAPGNEPLEGEILPPGTAMPKTQLEKIKDELRGQYPGNSEEKIEQAAKEQLEFEESQRRGAAIQKEQPGEKPKSLPAGNSKAPVGTETPSRSEQATPESKTGAKETQGVVSAEQQTPENVIFGRHGATALDKEGGKETVAGWSNEPLDDRGKAAAKQMAADLKDEGVTKIVTSDLPRAKQTADIVGKELGIPVVSDERLRPQHIPETEGKQVKDIQDVRDHYKSHPDEVPKDGESTNQFAKRQGEALAEINQMAKDGEKPLVITHSTNLEHHLGQKPEPGGIVKGGAHEGKAAEARGAVEKGGAPKETGVTKAQAAGSASTETNAAKPAKRLGIPYALETAFDTGERQEHYDRSGQAEIWRVRTDAGDADVFVHPGGGAGEAMQEAATILGQNVAMGVDMGNVFNKGTYKPTPEILQKEAEFATKYNALKPAPRKESWRTGTTTVKLPTAEMPDLANETANQKRFREEYTKRLKEAVQQHPDQYGYPVEKVPAVAAKMTQSLAKGTGNKDSLAIKGTLRELGIPNNYAAIKEFLNKRDVAVPSNAGGSQPGEPTRPAAPESKPQTKISEADELREASDETLQERRTQLLAALERNKKAPGFGRAAVEKEIVRIHDEQMRRFAEREKAPSLELTHPPADIGVKQYIQSLPADQRGYAKAVWEALKEKGAPDPHDIRPSASGTGAALDFEDYTGVKSVDYNLDPDGTAEVADHLRDLASRLTPEPKIEKEQPREQQNQRTGAAGETENVPRVSGTEGQGGNAPETVPARGNEATGEKRPTESGAGRENPERLEHPGGQPQSGNAHERGGGTGPAEHPPAERDGADGKPVKEPSPEDPEKAIETAAEKKNQRNFHITDEYANQIGAGGEITKIKGNLDALELLKEIQSEGREIATPDEQATLAKYVDFGGLVGMLQNYHKPEYAQHYERYKKILSAEERQEINETLPNTHYTSMQMVDGIWKAIQRLGFRGGRVLEPGMGIGNFFGRMPEKLTGKSDLFGVERNPLTGSMAKLLYADAKIIVKPFQKFLAPQNSLDLIVGNVPFQDVTITDDPLYSKLRLNLHNYFIVKSLDMLRPGGVAALITSRYTMDGVKGPSERAREEMAKRADLVAAIRLPETAFKGNANTYVVADLLIFKKRGPNEILDEMPDWIKTSEITVKGKAVSGNRWGTTYGTPDKNYSVNKYFIEHPENVLGEHSGEGKMYGPGGTYTVKPPDDFQASLDGAIERLPKNIYGKIKGKKVSDIEAPPVDSPAMGFAPDDVKPGAFFIDDKGNVKIKQSGVGAELPASLRTTEIVNHLKSAIGLREQLKAVHDLQLSSHDDDLLGDEQAKLNQLYDDYRKKYGTLHSPLLRKIFGEDPEYPRLLALENYDPESKEISKAAIFTKRVLEPYEPLRDLPADPKAAMLKVMAAQGYLDTPLMAKLLNESEDAIVKKLTDADLIYKDPVAGTLHTADEYLSGDVREKLRVAKDAADIDPDFKRNIKALEKVQPKPVTIHEAQPNLGATWIPISIYKSFVNHLMGGGNNDVDIYRNTEGKWTVSAAENKNKWNTGRVSAHKLVQYGLNQQQPTVWDRDSDGNRHINPAATTAAREKLAAIKEEFRTVLRRAPQATVDQLEDIYNTTFNSTKKREFNGDHLDFPGMSKEWKDKMRGYQKAFVWRALQEGRGGLFHAPGLGKTLTMIAAGMEAKRLKISPKNLYVVRNNMVPQWREDFKRFYPNSNVLAVQDEDFKDATARNKLMSRIATGDWDAVLLPQSQYDLLPIGPDFEQATIQRKLDDYRQVLQELDPKDDKRTIKQIEKAVDKLESRLNELNAKKKDNTITFDKMGFGMMFVDEAHDYKGMAVPTRMGNLKGLSKHTSDKALAMEMKTDFMRGTHNGRGVIFGTGTPLTNTIGEVYIMTKYLAPELLEKAGIRNFDDWAAQFATAVTTWEYAADGVTFRPSTSLSEYVNVPELSQMWQRFAEYLSTNDAVRLAGLKLPESRRKDITATVTPVQEPLLQQIADRGEHLFAHPPKTKEEMQADNWLLLSGDARKISLDPRLYDPGMDDDEGSKVNKTVAIIKKDLDESAENKGTVIVFSDFFEYHGDEGKFNLFDDIRKKLVKAGVPRDQIGIIQEAGDKQDAKEAMFAKVRAGKIRVLFGSTEKLGIGVNVQDRVYSMVHLDQPWRPDQVEQREARGVRSGNSYRAVNIYRMISEPRPGKVKAWDPQATAKGFVELKPGEQPPGDYKIAFGPEGQRIAISPRKMIVGGKVELSQEMLDDMAKDPEGAYGAIVEKERPRAYDLQMYQQLERKAHAQEQFLTGNYTGRTMEETGGDVKLNSQMFALGKAMSTGNPDALRKLKLEHDLKTQQLLERNFQTERSIQTRELSFAETRLAVNKEKIKLLQGAEKQWKDSTVGMEEERSKKLEDLRKELRGKNQQYYELEKESEERKDKARAIVNSETATDEEKKVARKAIRDINAKLKESAKSPELQALIDQIHETEEGGIGAPVQIGREVLDTREKRAAFFEQHPDMSEFVDTPVKIGGIDTTLKLQSEAKKDPQSGLLYQATSLVYKLPSAYGDDWHGITFDQEKRLFRPASFLNSFAGRARGLGTHVYEVNRQINSDTRDIESLKRELGQSDPYIEKLEAIEKEIKEIDIRLGKVDPHITQAPDDESVVDQDEGEEDEGLIRGEKGELAPGKLADVAIEAEQQIKHYLSNAARATKIARDIDRQLYTLDTAKQADILDAKQVMEKLKLPHKNDQALYHHLEDYAGNPLTKAEDQVLDDVLMPILEQNSELYQEASDGGFPIENYVHRVVKDKGGVLDKIMKGIKAIGPKGTLSKSAPALKMRTMMAIENPDGERRVVSIKGREVTMWQGGEPTELGELKNAKGKTPPDDTFPEGQPNSAFYDKGYVVEGPDGYDWKITQATTKEIEADTNLEYYHSALASTLVSNIQLRAAVRAMHFLNDLKASPEFEEIAYQGAHPPKGWKVTQLQQFRGIYFEPRTAEVLDAYYDRSRLGNLGALEQIGAFMRVAMLLNPLMHPLNVASSWAIERGATGFLPTEYGRMFRAGNKAVKAVLSQNQDFKDALTAGAPLQSHREAIKDITKLFFNQLAEGLEKKDDWAMKVAKALGIEHGNLLNALHKLSSKVAWIANDVLLLQSAYEHQAKEGMTFDAAIKEAGRIIPEYRVPTRILDSQMLSKLMTNRWATIFGPYHYSLLRSFGEIAKSAIGQGGEEKGEGYTRTKATAKAWDRIALIGLVMMGLYPVLDEIARKVSHDQHARVKRFGPFALLDLLAQVGEHKTSVSQAAQRVVTPAPQTKAAGELLTNTEFYSGRHIYDQHAPFPVQAQEIGRYLLGEMGQVGQYEKAQTEEQKRKFAWQQVGVTFAKTRAEKTAADIAAEKTGTAAETPEDEKTRILRRNILEELRKGNRKPLEQAEQKHEITRKQVHNLESRSHLEPLEDTVHGFSIEEVKKVLDAAKADKNAHEVQLLEKILHQKQRRAGFSWQATRSAS